MATTIKLLRCRIKVKSRSQRESLHEPARAERPSLEYAQPMGQETTHAENAIPAKTATEDRNASTQRERINPREADPKQVADRVYELMKEEVRLGRLRGER